jgi:integrase
MGLCDLWCSRLGTQPSRSRFGLSGQFRRLLKAAGLRDTGTHILRHTAATLMLSEGVHPKVASERLGHASIAITLDMYSHVSPTMQEEAQKR